MKGHLVERRRIRKIYKNYFDIIESYFGSIKHYLGDSEDSHIDLGIHMANYPLISDLIIDAVYDLDNEVAKFWRENASIIFDYTRDQNALKCLYSGDITPVILENFIKKSALYIDTVILPDPIFNLTLVKEFYANKKYFLSKLIRHVFNIWKLRDLLLADSKNDIIIILPVGLHLMSERMRKSMIRKAENKYKGYINRITSQNFESLDETNTFWDGISTSRDLFSHLKDVKSLPNSFQDMNSLDNFLRNFSEPEIKGPLGGKSVGWNFGLYLRSQFIRVQEHKYFCEKLVAEPIYDYELPWFFYTYDAGGPGLDASIANSLQKERFKWLTKVPIKAIKDFREENTLDYMRSILRTGITDLKAKNDKDLSAVSKQLQENLKDAFNQQSSEIRALEKKVRRTTKIEIPLTTTGFLAGFIPYLGNVISLCMAGRDIKKLLRERKEAKEILSKKKGSMINILMKTSNE